MTSILSKATTKVSLVAVGRRSVSSTAGVRNIIPSSWSSFFDSSKNNNVSSSSKVPKTFAEALLEQNKAIVVTTADATPKIVYVNDAWERMCGYKKEEVIDQTLECIQGVDTNKELANRGVEQLLATKGTESTNDNVVDLYLINYKKNGTAFTNHLQMGTMKVNEMFNDVSMFVGVLEEVQPSQVPLRMI